MLVTVFQMNGRISVKFELGLLEQTYKFRDNEHLQSLADVQRLVDTDFVQSVLRQMLAMTEVSMAAMQRNLPVKGGEFEDII